MRINSRLWLYSASVPALVAALQMAGCTTDDSDPQGTGGMAGAGGKGGGSSTGGNSSTGGGGGSAPTGSVCANPVTIPAANKLIADFDTYDGSDLSKWSYALGGDSAVMVYAGPFGYGDRDGNKAETYEMTDGYNSTKYAVRVADTNAEKYGGGMGIWLSPACINANSFSGISFWVKGNAPTGKGIFKISMGETTPSTPAMAGGAFGTCPGDEMTCKHPSYEFPITDTWTEVKVSWAMLKAGDAAGTPVIPDGKHISQFGIDIGLVWAAGPDGMTYVPTAAPYELVVDSMNFY